MVTTIAGLDTATHVLGNAVVGPTQIQAALGVDPLAALTEAERAAIARVPFTDTELTRARADGGALLVLRIPRLATGPLSMLALAERLGSGLDPKVHQGVGYSLRGEWTIDDQPFATTEVCDAAWRLVRRTPLPTTCNKAYRAQDDALAALGPDGGVPRRRSAVEIAYDTLLWHRTTGERLLGDQLWDWSRSESTDQGLAALGEFSERGLRVIAYSRAVKFGTLGVCVQR